MKRITALFCAIVCFLGVFAHFSPSTAAADASSDILCVNGQMKSVSALKVGGNNYFKLRDVAAALSGTGKAFDVSYSDPKQQISILPGRDYTPNPAAGNEPAPDFSKAKYELMPVDFQGRDCPMNTYNVQDHYYFKLRDVLKLLNVGAFWDERRAQVYIDTSYDYIEEGYQFKPQGNTVILMYHDFTAAAPEAGTEGEVTTAAKFEADLRALLDAGYKAVSLEDLYLGRTKAGEKYFVVTCDDGYLSNYRLAYPILKKLGIPMDIFINTDNIGLSHHFSLAQGKEMEDSGLVKIYSHYPKHVALTWVDPSAIRDEIWRSQDTLESGLTPKRIYFFAYPHGLYNAATYKQVARSGAVMQLVQDPNPKLPQLLIRVNVSYDTDILELVESAHKN